MPPLCDLSYFFLADNTIQDANGGNWKFTQFEPSFLTGSPSPIIHIAMTIGSAPDHCPTFKSLREYHDQRRGCLPELNHFVAISADGAIEAQGLAVSRFRYAVNVANKELLDVGIAVMDALQAVKSCKSAGAKLRATKNAARLEDEQVKVRWCIDSCLHHNILLSLSPPPSPLLPPPTTCLLTNLSFFSPFAYNFCRRVRT